MANTVNYFKSFIELRKLARRATGNATSGGPRQSLPVPVRRRNQLQIAFMYCPIVVISGPLRLWPPSQIAWMDPTNGNLIELTKVSPSDFNQTDSADKPLKEKSDKYPDLTVDAFLSLEKRLFVLYDLLFEVWAIESSSTVHNKLQDSSREFLKIFDQVSEQALQSYYYTLGSDWFGWLRELAK